MIHTGRRKGAAHVNEYPLLPDGRLRVGSQCFKGARLKRRFETRADAAEWIAKNASKFASYECIGCRGWHLTTPAKKASA